MSMRDLFSSYYRPTREEFDKMWGEGVFSFDTNVLLNVYRYTLETRARLFDLFRRLNSRIWIPHQVAYEYHERRLDVITDQFKSSKAIEKQLAKSLEDVGNELKQHKNHSFANVDLLAEIIKEAVEKAQKTLQEAESRHPDLLRSDELLEIITDLFNDKIGQPYSDDRLEEIYKEAEERYKRNIPPGYEDARDKDDQRKYGDVVLWYQLIDYAKSEEKPLVFVTGERKKDWWLRHEGRTIGPRRELTKEIFAKAGVLFYIYSTDQFMEQAEAFLGLKDHRGAIEEVRKIRQRDEANTSRSLWISELQAEERENMLDVDDKYDQARTFVATVITKWVEVEKAIFSASERVGIISSKKQYSSFFLLTELEARGYINHDTVNVLDYLREIRNRVIHGNIGNEDTTSAMTASYVVLANNAISALDSVR